MLLSFQHDHALLRLPVRRHSRSASADLAVPLPLRWLLCCVCVLAQRCDRPDRHAAILGELPPLVWWSASLSAGCSDLACTPLRCSSPFWLWSGCFRFCATAKSRSLSPSAPSVLVLLPLLPSRSADVAVVVRRKAVLGPGIASFVHLLAVVAALPSCWLSVSS
jgi:hypothetical protein